MLCSVAESSILGSSDRNLSLDLSANNVSIIVEAADAAVKFITNIVYATSQRISSWSVYVTSA